MAALIGDSEVATGPVSVPLPQAPSEQLATEIPVPSSQQYSLLAPSDGDSTLRSRVPNSLSLEEAKRIQKDYEAPFKDLIHQNPIKTNDFKHSPVWFQDSPYSHNLRLSVGIFPALLVVLSLSGKPLLGTLSLGALATYFSLNFSIHRHSLVVCLMTIIAAEVSTHPIYYRLSNTVVCVKILNLHTFCLLLHWIYVYVSTLEVILQVE